MEDNKNPDGSSAVAIANIQNEPNQDSSTDAGKNKKEDIGVESAVRGQHEYAPSLKAGIILNVCLLVGGFILGSWSFLLALSLTYSIELVWNPMKEKVFHAFKKVFYKDKGRRLTKREQALIDPHSEVDYDAVDTAADIIVTTLSAIGMLGLVTVTTNPLLWVCGAIVSAWVSVPAGFVVQAVIEYFAEKIAEWRQSKEAARENSVNIEQERKPELQVSEEIENKIIKDEKRTEKTEEKLPQHLDNFADSKEKKDLVNVGEGMKVPSKSLKEEQKESSNSMVKEAMMIEKSGSSVNKVEEHKNELSTQLTQSDKGQKAVQDSGQDKNRNNSKEVIKQDLSDPKTVRNPTTRAELIKEARGFMKEIPLDPKARDFGTKNAKVNIIPPVQRETTKKGNDPISK